MAIYVLMVISVVGCGSRKSEDWEKLSWLEKLFTDRCVAGCDNKINDKATIARLNAEQAADHAAMVERDRRVASACQASVQTWLDSWSGGKAMILDSSSGNVLPTTTGYSYLSEATISGHTGTLSSNCFTDKNYNLLDLQARWLN